MVQNAAQAGPIDDELWPSKLLTQSRCVLRYTTSAYSPSCRVLARECAMTASGATRFVMQSARVSGWPLIAAMAATLLCTWLKLSSVSFHTRAHRLYKWVVLLPFTVAVALLLAGSAPNVETAVLPGGGLPSARGGAHAD